jgi:hypothetical protein
MPISAMGSSVSQEKLRKSMPVACCMVGAKGREPSERDAD